MKRNNTVQESVITLPIDDVELQSKCRGRSKRDLIKIITFNFGIAASVAIIIILVEFDVIPPRNTGFYCKDPKLSFKFTGDTVDATFLGVSVLLFPAIIIYITEHIFVRNGTFKEKSVKSLKSTLCIYRGFLLGIIMNFILMELMKFIKRDPRPTFFDICNPDTGINCTAGEYIDNFKCIPDPRFLAWFQHDATLSFPSGHTSLSCYSGLFVVWYLQRRAFNWTSHYFIAVPLVQWLCILYAVTCSITRITDHRHHWWDVLGGFIIAVVTVVYSIAVLCKNFQVLEKSPEKSSHVPYNHHEDDRGEQIPL